MILYHGSYISIETPDLNHSRKNVDFGAGFYVTPIYDQAKKWSEKFKRRSKDGIISIYSIDDTLLDDFKLLEFDSYSEEWLDFIMKCPFLMLSGHLKFYLSNKIMFSNH